jgi:hypothetical protein
MPNWCDCELTVTGDVADLHAFADFIKTDKSDFDFNTIIPYPEKFRELDRIAYEWDKDNPNNWKDRPKDGFNQGGYEWCIQNWGTKWNLGNGDWDSVQIDMLDCEIEPHMTLCFQTAWAPPSPVVLEASIIFPTLTFKLEYYEGGMGFQGKYVARAGEVVCDLEGEYTGYRGG